MLHYFLRTDFRPHLCIPDFLNSVSYPEPLEFRVRVVPYVNFEKDRTGVDRGSVRPQRDFKKYFLFRLLGHFCCWYFDIKWFGRYMITITIGETLIKTQFCDTTQCFSDSNCWYFVIFCFYIYKNEVCLSVCTRWIQKPYIQSSWKFGKLLGMSPERFLQIFIKIRDVVLGPFN
jgi:hypothetical protein